jgi:hypothetical protein
VARRRHGDRSAPSTSLRWAHPDVNEGRRRRSPGCDGCARMLNRFLHDPQLAALPTGAVRSLDCGRPRRSRGPARSARAHTRRAFLQTVLDCDALLQRRAPRVHQRYGRGRNLIATSVERASAPALREPPSSWAAKAPGQRATGASAGEPALSRCEAVLNPELARRVGAGVLLRSPRAREARTPAEKPEQPTSRVVCPHCSAGIAATNPSHPTALSSKPARQSPSSSACEDREREGQPATCSASEGIRSAGAYRQRAQQPPPIGMARVAPRVIDAAATRASWIRRHRGLGTFRRRDRAYEARKRPLHATPATAGRSAKHRSAY